ncbi:Protein N-acetyltransferase, RimJ/RimL family [Hymenobacter daecheongensis DSM 21074]|uniref:Protein N-acetyltransferase, RimJ/RimL family n=1 Tax=Hymenobacter daecheongensis DSM 21074 TaxID=1121955 RepID=A0A1M6D2P3_9BACT|nr:GNAT family N-acetyltransferase [Hymenobacter daecheongensis]SHI67344.1 Protein N-acetyltransferase, RimJ/RimL family [Hymenobacter daecheongensis DSM 21074]
MTAAPLFAPPLVPIHTARLVLRPYGLADEPAFFGLIDANRPRLSPAFPARVAAVQTPADARRVLATFRQDWQTGRLYVLGIWHRETAAYLGDISLKPTWTAAVTAEIGYYLAAEAEGRGYAREALVAAVDFGFAAPVRAVRLSIRCRPDNPRSMAVAEHVGFRRLPVRSRWAGRGAADIIHYGLDRPA